MRISDWSSDVCSSDLSTIQVSGFDPVVIANRVQSPSVRGNPIKGPYLVLIVAGQYPEAHGYAPLRAYAQPILSGRRFIPIDSEFERAVPRDLIRSTEHTSELKSLMRISYAVICLKTTNHTNL